MKTQPRTVATLIATFSTVALAECSGCEKNVADFLDQFAATFGSLVPISPGDRTPPTVTLTIPNEGSGQIVLGGSSASATIAMSNSAGFFIVAVAEDPEGVKQVGFSGSSFLNCKSGNIAFNQYGDLLGPTDSDKGTGGQALTRRWLPRYIDDSYLQCPSGWTRIQATLTLRADGLNFGGLAGHSASATFVWK